MHAARRQSLLERMAPRSLALFHAGRLKRRNHDVFYRFRPESSFYYLCGLSEADTGLLLQRDTQARRIILFREPPTERSERWTGKRGDMDEVAERLGIDESVDVAELAGRLTDSLRGTDTLYYSFGLDPEIDRLVIDAVRSARAATRDRGGRPRSIVDPETLLGEMRLIKATDEIERVRQAAAITIAAHREAMATCRPGMSEYELEARLDATFRQRGATGPAYPTIVGGGNNATVLHYTANTDRLRDGDLVLIDAGAEYEGYAADITRTFPVGGRFTPCQRNLYTIVLAAQQAAIDTVAPGISFDAPHQAARRALAEGLVELGLLDGPLDEVLSGQALDRYYMHRTSHWLGLDVHDIGAWRTDDGFRTLQAGMILTIEPGLYIGAEEQDVAEGYRGIGIRIEDDILVTADGHENLTAAMPRSPEEIETLCRD